MIFFLRGIFTEGSSLFPALCCCPCGHCCFPHLPPQPSIVWGQPCCCFIIHFLSYMLCTCSLYSAWYYTLFTFTGLACPLLNDSAQPRHLGLGWLVLCTLLVLLISLVIFIRKIEACLLLGNFTLEVEKDPSCGSICQENYLLNTGNKPFMVFPCFSYSGIPVIDRYQIKQKLNPAYF